MIFEGKVYEYVLILDMYNMVTKLVQTACFSLDGWTYQRFSCFAQQSESQEYLANRIYSEKQKSKVNCCHFLKPLKKDISSL